MTLEWVRQQFVHDMNFYRATFLDPPPGVMIDAYNDFGSWGYYIWDQTRLESRHLIQFEDRDIGAVIDWRNSD